MPPQRYPQKLTECQAHDDRSSDDILDDIDKDMILLADRACDSDAISDRLNSRGAWH